MTEDKHVVSQDVEERFQLQLQYRIDISINVSKDATASTCSEIPQHYGYVIPPIAHIWALYVSNPANCATADKSPDFPFSPE